MLECVHETNQCNGSQCRIEPEGPLNLPDGTPVIILRRIVGEKSEEKLDDSPEAISLWLQWYDSLEPLVFTEAERKALEADRRDRREWELAHSEDDTDKLRELWR